MKKLLLCIFIIGCATRHASLAVLPEPPIHPALENPELMSEKDAARLADFYRRYEIFLKKYKAYKKIFEN